MNRILASIVVCCMVVLLSASPSMSKSHKFRTVGVITEIKEKDQMFTVKKANGETVSFKVDQRSEFELEHQHHHDDKDVSFQEIKVGDQVKVKAYQGNPPLVDDVEIYR